MASQFVASYDPQLITVTWAGRIFTGYADSIVSISAAADSMTPYVGVTGETLFVWNANKGATVTLTLHQSSPDNAFMAAQDSARTIAPIQVQDNNTGRFIIRGASAAIQTRPTYARAAENSSNEWVLYVANGQSQG